MDHYSRHLKHHLRHHPPHHLKHHPRHRLRRLFLVFLVVGLIGASGITLYLTRPKASQTTPPARLQSVHGTLSTSNGNPDFFLHIPDENKDLVIRGQTSDIDNQLSQRVGRGEITLYGILTPNKLSTPTPSSDQKQSLKILDLFSVYSLTPPPVTTDSCIGDGSDMDFTYVVSTSINPIVDAPTLVNQLGTAMRARLRQGNDQASLIGFAATANNLSIKQNLTFDLNSFVNSFNSLVFTNTTPNVSAGVQLASDYLPAERRYRQNGSWPGIIILITSKDSTVGDDVFQIAKQDYAQKNIRYYTISLGGWSSRLNELAEQSGGYGYYLSQSDQIQNVVDQLFSRINEPFANCLSFELKSNRISARPGTKVTLTYTLHNTTHADITRALVTHTLPAGFVGPDQTSVVTFPIAALLAGQTEEQSVIVKRSK